MQTAVQVQTMMSFFEPELLEMDEAVLKEIAADPAMSDYDTFIDGLLRQKAHALPKEQEKLMAMMGQLTQAPQNIFSMLTDVDMKFPDVIMPDGSARTLTEGTYSLWNGETQYQGTAGRGIMGGFLEGEEIQRPDFPGRDDGQVEIPPQPTNPIVTQGTQQPPAGEQPENMPVPPMPEGGSDIPVPPMPEGGENMPMPQPPAGVQPPPGGRPSAEFTIGILSADFPITRGANYFTNVCPVE
jgi:hypothetical protein